MKKYSEDWFMDYAEHALRVIELEQEWLEMRYRHLYGVELRGRHDVQWTKDEHGRFTGSVSSGGGSAGGGKSVDKSGKNVIINASGRIKISMQFFANKNIPKMSSRELKKSISTWEQLIKKHENYILEPRDHCPEWDTFDIRKQQGLIKHWLKEIQNFNNDIQEAKIELKKRGE